MTEIHNIDLNLVRVFNAVLEERGVTKAAERLRLTQSAISHALAKLRSSLGDQLFIRGPDGMHPTPRALELAQSLRPALHQIDEAFARPNFNPRTTEMEFSISTTDYLTGALMPEFMARIRRDAPNARCWLRPLSNLNLTEELDRGTVHLAIGSFGSIPARFISEPLFSDPNVWIMRQGHPASLGPFGLRELSAYPHLDILISGQIQSTAGATIDQGGLERAYISSNPQHIEGLLKSEGLTRRVGAIVSHILTVPSLVAATDMLAFVPRQFALQASRTLGLAWKDPPYQAPMLQISMLSHRTMGSHSSIAWLRKQLIESSKKFKNVS